jgi:hypothetical protein
MVAKRFIPEAKRVYPVSQAGFIPEGKPVYRP